MDLDEVAGRLYALPPSEFIAARDAEARAAKEAGEAGLAREISGLRKPTVSAWAVNRAVREHSDALQELLDLGAELRAAWEARDADALAELTRRRAEVSGRVGRLVKEAAGLSAAAAAEADQTLDAAVVDAGAAAQVRAGRLVKPLSYSGFAPAPAPLGTPASRRAPASGRTAAEPDGTAGRTRAAKRTAGRAAEGEEGAEGAEGAGKAAVGRAAEAARRRTEEEAARARARQQVEERRARERREAEAALGEWQEALAEAVREHDERAERVALLERKLAKARRRLAESEKRLEVARREERHARHRLER